MKYSVKWKRFLSVILQTQKLQEFGCGFPLNRFRFEQTNNIIDYIENIGEGYIDLGCDHDEQSSFNHHFEQMDSAIIIFL